MPAWDANGAAAIAVARAIFFQAFHFYLLKKLFCSYLSFIVVSRLAHSSI